MAPDPVTTDTRLADRTVLVTGGNGGIGLGMASACGRAGAQVVIWGRKEAKNAEALEHLRAAGTTAHAFVCDVDDPAQIARTFEQSVDAAGGRIDSVFANAGTSGEGTQFLDLTYEEWSRVLRTNLDGTFLTLQAAARHMVEKGGGSLVAVSSTSAIHGSPNSLPYGVSKTRTPRPRACARRRPRPPPDPRQRAAARLDQDRTVERALRLGQVPGERPRRGPRSGDGPNPTSSVHPRCIWPIRR